MKTKNQWIRWGIALFGVSALLIPIVGQQRPESAQRALVSQYCLTCHNNRAQTGGFSLEGLDPDRPEANPEVWEKVSRKLRAGLMPPTGAPRPERTVLDTFRHTLESTIDTAAKATLNPGAAPL